MKKRKILKGAVVLLTAVALIFSTGPVTADTLENIEIEQTCLTECSQNILTKELNIPTVHQQSGGRAVLWDNGLPDERNGCSCGIWSTYDRQLIDDFTVDGEGWSVCDSHSRHVTWSSLGPESILAVKVFFYKNLGTDCDPDPQIFAERDASFNAYLTGDFYFDRQEIAIDCEFDCVDLTPGKWWVCIQPECTENIFWLTAEDKLCPVYLSYPDQGHNKWTPGYPAVFTEDYDLSFQLTGDSGQPCEPCIDVENYIWDPKLSEWKDADTENEAVDLPICEEGEKKITIHNCGDCPLYNIVVFDKLHDSLEYIKAVPEPSNVAYDPPYYYLEWHFEGPLMPCEIIEIIITFHVVGEECSIDENIVDVTAVCEHGITVSDSDIAYVHCYKPSRSIERPFLQLLENHPNLFPLLQKLLKLLGLF
jgi:hypothetical protein